MIYSGIDVENFADFDSAEQVLAYAGFEPSVYQSGQMVSTHAKMAKRGSKYHRYGIFNVAKCLSSGWAFWSLYGKETF